MKMRVLTKADLPARGSVDFEPSKKIHTLEFQDKVKSYDSKTGDYVIEQVLVETETIDTQEYIQSFAGDVGIENILKKFDLVGDPNLLEQVKRPTVAIAEDGKEIIQDYSNLPSDEQAALEAVAKARAEFSQLPEELTKGRSFQEFAETCTTQELIDYIQSLQKKEGE